MSETVVATVAERKEQHEIAFLVAVLRTHERFGMQHCGCARWAEVDPGATHSEHVARALVRAGLITSLPR